MNLSTKIESFGFRLTMESDGAGFVTFKVWRESPHNPSVVIETVYRTQDAGSLVVWIQGYTAACDEAARLRRSEAMSE